jgi:hypothetical protein
VGHVHRCLATIVNYDLDEVACATGLDHIQICPLTGDKGMMNQHMHFNTKTQAN